MITILDIQKTRALLQEVESTKRQYLVQYHETHDEKFYKMYIRADSQLLGAEQAITMLGFYVYKDSNGDYQIKVGANHE